MKKRVVSLFLVLSFIFILSCAPPEKEPDVNSAGEAIRVNPDRTIDTPAPLLGSRGFGDLCAGEEECVIFCRNNRGRCEDYCKGRGDELCRVIFPPEMESDKRFQQKEDCVNNPKPVFTHAFTDITKLTEISRYGNNALYNPGSQARSYVVVREGDSTPVYAPTNVTITRIYFSDKNYSQFFDRELVRPEYRIDFTVSCEVKVAYDHIVSLSNKLKPFAPQVSAPGKNDGVVVSIPLQAGEVIGYTSGGFPGRAFDFFFLNYAREEEHLNPSRWTTDHSRYMDCPYDYFSDELKQQYVALIPEVKSVRDCGPNFREVPNTILGYWFQGNATENNGARFAISEGKHFVEWTIILGNEPPIPYRNNEAEWIDPETVTEGKTACYYDSDRNAYVYVKMLPNDKVALASGTGACPSAFPENRAEVFER